MSLVRISSSLRDYSGSSAEIQVSGSTIGEVLFEFRRDQPKLYSSICDETGKVRKHVNLFINSDWIPAQQEKALNTPVHSRDIITIWQAVSGG